MICNLHHVCLILCTHNCVHMTWHGYRYAISTNSTGIALACLCRSYGHRLHIVMPDDQAEEKRQLLER